MRFKSFFNPVRTPIATLAVAGGFGLSLLAGNVFAQTAPGAGVFQDTLFSGQQQALPFNSIGGATARVPSVSDTITGTVDAVAPPVSQAGPIAGSVFESTNSAALTESLSQPQGSSWVPPLTGGSATKPGFAPPPMASFVGPPTQTWMPSSVATAGSSSRQPVPAYVEQFNSPQYVDSAVPVQSGQFAPQEFVGDYGQVVGGPVVLAEGFDMGEYAGYSTAPVQTFIPTNQIYQPAIAAGVATGIATGVSGGRRANTLFGISGLAFSLNDGDVDKSLSRNSSGQGLSTSSIDQDDLDGVEAVFARRKSYGAGWEARYFNLDSGSASTSIGGNPYVDWAGPGYIGKQILDSKGLSGVGFQGVSAAQVFNDADTHTFSRESNINNFEFNWLLRARLSGRRNVENFIGFRYFQFDDSLAFSASGIRPSSVPGYTNPEFAQYHSDVENDLYGVQIGRRSQIPLFNRLSLHLGVSGGVFNNRITSDQHTEYRLRDGSYATPQVLYGKYTGTPSDSITEKDDLSVLGEVDFGLIYQISNRMRARIGYRGIGATDIAFASDQLEHELWDIDRVGDINNEADLLLNGGYAGLEFAW